MKGTSMILAMIFVVIITVLINGGMTYSYMKQLFTPNEPMKSTFEVCDNFCLCGKGNLTITTFRSTNMGNGFSECECLVSQFSNTTVFRQPERFVVNENYTCGE